MLTAERLREVLIYNPETGIFTWLVRARPGAEAGDVAGCIDRLGYRRIAIDGGQYKAHRLAWLYVCGAFPANGMDHINGDPADNRICNLREATQGENNQNTKSYRNSSSKYLGVSWHTLKKKWQAQITVNGKQHYLGYFANEEEAHSAYCAAKTELHTFNPAQRLNCEQ